MPHRHLPSVGDALKADLARLGISQAELARRMDEGLTQQAISKWIQHNKVPDDRIPKLGEVLGQGAEVLKLAHSSLVAREAPASYGRTPMKSREEPERPDLRAHTEKALVRELLPEHLRPNTDVRVQLATGWQEFDYLSSVLALELKTLVLPHNNFFSIMSRAEHKLLLLQRLQPDPNRRHVIAMMVPESQLNPPTLNLASRLSGEIAVLGLSFHMFPSAEHAARYIIDTEDEAAHGVKDMFE